MATHVTYISDLLSMAFYNFLNFHTFLFVGPSAKVIISELLVNIALNHSNYETVKKIGLVFKFPYPFRNIGPSDNVWCKDNPCFGCIFNISTKFNNQLLKIMRTTFISRYG